MLDVLFLYSFLSLTNMTQTSIFSFKIRCSKFDVGSSMLEVRCWTFIPLSVPVPHQHDADIHNIGSSGACDDQISKGLKERVGIVSPKMIHGVKPL
jgi:hypothetical protein